MPDEGLGTTAGVATLAAEVSNAIVVANRASFAYMQTTTYMTHTMVQVAMMNIHKLPRVSSANSKAKNDNMPLPPFLHRQLSRGCQRGSGCECQSSIEVDGRRETEFDLVARQAGSGGLATPVAAASRCAAAPVGDSVLDGNAGGDGGPASLAVGNDGEASKLVGRKEDVLCLPIDTEPLTDEHVVAVDASSVVLSPAAVVRTENRANITLTVADIRVLTSEKWLNNEVMNSFVALINLHAKLLAPVVTGTPSLLSDATLLSAAPRT
eukprot:TRINITY_DN2224_c0_g1_i2.p1 TRINITY_DN2224_c0_g1~~TRINITY_DN2224_c0_g1_i2.p1  ORF type:complete len:267 (-),score=53.75 TRINITY_DN2224_c0_g1_i2:1611-2411(-)